MKKVDQAIAIYKANAGAVRATVIAAIKNALNISDISAATYYQTAKRMDKEGKLIYGASGEGTTKAAPNLANEVTVTMDISNKTIESTLVKPKKAKAERLVSTLTSKAVEATYSPSRSRIAIDTRNDILSKTWDAMTPEEQANWSNEITEWADHYEKNPIFKR